MGTRFERMADGTLAVWVHPTLDARLVTRIANALEDKGAVMGKRIEGLEELYWDFEFAGKTFTIHNQHYLGIALLANDRDPETEEVLRSTAESVVRELRSR